MNVNLATLRQVAAERYASTDIELSDGSVAVLHNPLRLTEAERRTLGSVSDQIKEEDASQVAVLEGAIRVAGKGSPEVEKLIEELAGDLALLLVVFEQYGSAVQLGEASDSES